ncbi:MAG: ABC transporter substrate-binding protein, partial [Rhodoferax sp.]|nr:ABC transporter substrate-binding protein [Rhodoferax sp.]
WAAAGIKVNLKPMETAPLIALWTKGDYGLMSIALSWSPDPDAIVSYLTSTNLYGKGMGMADTQLDKMVEDARSILELPKRAAAYQQIQKRIADQAYGLQIYQYPLRWEAWRSYVKGYVPLAANIRSFVRTTWIAK